LIVKKTVVPTEQLTRYSSFRPSALLPLQSFRPNISERRNPKVLCGITRGGCA